MVSLNANSEFGETLKRLEWLITESVRQQREK
jgi:hypothetical protein